MSLGMRKGIFYGWVIVAAAFLAQTLASGTRFSFGVFLPPLRESFGWSTAATSAGYSIGLFLSSLFALFAGWGVDKYGPRITIGIGGFLIGLGILLTSQVNSLLEFYATYGVLTGIGMAAIYAPLTTTTTRWFLKRRGLALGFVTSGMGAGPLITAPVASYLIASVGWRSSFMAISASALAIIGAAMFLKKDPKEIGQFPDGEEPSRVADQASLSKTGGGRSLADGGFSVREAVGTRAFWMLGSINFLVGAGLHAVMVHIVACGVSRGLSPMNAASVLSIVGGVSVVGRITVGAVSDRIGSKKALGVCVFMEGLMLLVLAGTSAPWVLYPFAAIFGFAYGGHSPQFPALPGELLGLRRMGMIMGALGFFWGVGGVLGPVLVGRIADSTGSYAGGFLVAGIAMLLTVVAVVFLNKPVPRGQVG